LNCTRPQTPTLRVPKGKLVADRLVLCTLLFCHLCSQLFYDKLELLPVHVTNGGNSWQTVYHLEIGINAMYLHTAI